MTALRTPTMKESQLLREKTTSSVFVSTCSNAVHAQFHCIDLHTHATPGHVTSFACSRNTSDRSLAYCSHHGRRSTRAIEVKHETLPANRTRLLVAPVDLLPVLAVDLLACSRRRHCSPTRDGHQPVMTGHNNARSSKDRSRKKAVMAAI